jgi:SAM-dependent methyltransferase
VSVRRTLLERLYAAVDDAFRAKILRVLPRGAGLRLLDVGCDDGAWTERVRQAVGIVPADVAGIEVDPERRALAAARGFDVRAADLDAAWPFPDSSFEVVHANQVIEHVTRLDHFVTELTRVLRPGGVAVVGTENLASWHNVAALALGFMPFSSANASCTGTLGNPFALHMGEPNTRGESWQHVHVLTTVGLRALFEAHGLVVERVFAAGYYPVFGKLAALLASYDPRHAHLVGVAVRRAWSDQART